jgi:hypothetical protein
MQNLPIHFSLNIGFVLYDETFWMEEGKVTKRRAHLLFYIQ